MTTTTATKMQAPRPGLTAWLRMFEAEAKMILREPVSLLFPLGLPLLMVAAQGTLFLAEPDHEVVPGVTAFDYYALPLTITMVVAAIAAITFPSFLGTYRKTKILRRLAVTPASPAGSDTGLAGHGADRPGGGQLPPGTGGHHPVVDRRSARLLHHPPVNLFMTVLVLLALSVAMYALGMLIASIARSPNAANAIGFILFMLFAALGGMFASIEMLPSPLDAIGAWLPFGAGVAAVLFRWE